MAAYADVNDVLVDFGGDACEQARRLPETSPVRDWLLDIAGQALDRAGDPDPGIREWYERLRTEGND